MDAKAISEQLGYATESRVEIEQAKDIMATTCCSADEAFDQLVRQSQRQNTKLHYLARGDRLARHSTLLDGAVLRVVSKDVGPENIWFGE